MLFNLLAVCCWALFTISTGYALLFACCSKKKPRPKRGGINQLRTNLNQLPAPESAKQPKGLKSLKSPQSSKQQLAGAKSGTQGKKAPLTPNAQLAVGGQKKKMLKPPESPPNKPTPAIIVPSSTTNLGPSPHGVDVPPTIEPLDDSEIIDEDKEIHKVDEETQTILRGEQVQGMVALIKSQKQEIASRKPSTTSVDAAQQTSTKVRTSMERHPHHHRGRHSRQSHAIELVKMVDKEQQTSNWLIGSKTKKSQRSTTAAEEKWREPPPPPPPTPAAAGTRSRIVETGTGSRVEASNRSERAATAAPVSEAEEEPKATEEKGLETVRIFAKEDVPKKSAKESSKSSEEESSSRSSSGSADDSGPTQSRRPPTPPPRKQHRRRRR